jgi:Tripartite tricarboxylate transporter TctB family
MGGATARSSEVIDDPRGRAVRRAVTAGGGPDILDNTHASRDGETVATTRTVELVTAALIFLVGALFVYNSYLLGFGWSSDGPQSGYFPFYIAVILCGASATIFVQALRRRDPKGATAFVERAQLKQVLYVLVPALVYVLGIQLIGIYLSSAIYITLFMRYLGKYPWWKSALLGIAINVAFFMMFEVWFQVPLYKGLWDVTSFTGY